MVKDEFSHPLAAALVAFEERTIGVEFVTFDEKLARAASSEGFSVLPDAL